MLSCFRAGSLPWLAGRRLKIRLSDLFHRLRFDRELGVAVVSSESIRWSVHHRKLEIPLQWHKLQEPANLVVCALEDAARSGIALPPRAKLLESKCRVHRSAQPREPRQVPLVQQRRILYGGHSNAICCRRSCPSLSAIACWSRDRRLQVHSLRRHAFVGSPRTCSKNDCAS